jgi:raffinose/stachyose/melibiose transport system permease protein
MMEKKTRLSDHIWVILLSILAVAYLYPIFMILINSLKEERAIGTSDIFNLPTSETFAGFTNYINALGAQGFARSLGYSVLITITSVIAILVCCSMCAWYITRVKAKFSSFMYTLCAFSMVVPFQMVMFTLALVSDRLGLNTPWGIIIIYLGFGAGLAVFMFCGFVKSIPLEIEEAAMIDGCNPLQTFFIIVLPIMKPTYISVGILETMWIWNDFLLPYLVLDTRKYKTISIVVQYMKGSYGRIDMGAIMAALIMAVIPVIIFYLACQKHIIKGVAAGAVKG